MGAISMMAFLVILGFAIGFMSLALAGTIALIALAKWALGA